jgi:hypothetical protein
MSGEGMQGYPLLVRWNSLRLSFPLLAVSLRRSLGVGRPSAVHARITNCAIPVFQLQGFQHGTRRDR